MLHGVYPLHRLLEDNSMKSYGEDKAHRNSTNNTFLSNCGLIALQQREIYVCRSNSFGPLDNRSTPVRHFGLRTT